MIADVCPSARGVLRWLGACSPLVNVAFVLPGAAAVEPSVPLKLSASSSCSYGQKEQGSHGSASPLIVGKPVESVPSIWGSVAKSGKSLE